MILFPSVAVAYDYLLLDGVKFEVINIDPVKKRGTTFGNIADLKKMDEG